MDKQNDVVLIVRSFTARFFSVTQTIVTFVLGSDLFFYVSASLSVTSTLSYEAASD